jgi:hypothetical protein
MSDEWRVTSDERWLAGFLACHWSLVTDHSLALERKWITY